jgi:hypothetical protein
MKEEQLPSREECYLSYLHGNISCPLWAEDGVRYDLVGMACNGHINWLRYLFNSFKLDCWNRYFFCSRMDQTLALVGCNTM